MLSNQELLKGKKMTKQEIIEFQTLEFAKWAEENLMDVTLRSERDKAVYMQCFYSGIKTGLKVAKEVEKDE